MRVHALCGAVSLAALCAGEAAAQETAQTAAQEDARPDAASIGDREFAMALQGLLQAQDYEGALKLLDRRPDLARRRDGKLLQAQLLALAGREQEAITLLEAHLTTDPDDAVGRFQIGELNFSARRDTAATLAYRLALSGDLDPMRQGMAQTRLAQIQDRRDWRVWAGASISPDSNLNTATDASRVDLFGLPFELDSDARKQGGVSLSAFGGVERRFQPEKALSWRAGIQGSVLDAPGAPSIKPPCSCAQVPSSA